MRIVIKIGTSTLAHSSGHLNIRRVEELCKVISDIKNAGNQVIVVSSGAIGVGMGKLGLPEKPTSTKEKQALAAIGQCELMFMYDKLFGEYNNMVAQVLLTRGDVDTEHGKENVLNTFNTLLSMGIIPIVNENDTVAIDELEGHNFGDNDMLSAIVAKLVSADGLVILTNIDGLYDADPRKNKDAKRLERVEKITEEIEQMAGGSGSNRGTGGMTTKVMAAKYVTEAGIDCFVIAGDDPERIYDVTDGKSVGTLFCANK